jgi:hypothetical protein
VNPAQTPAAPTAGTVTQPTCATATGSSRLQAILHPPSFTKGKHIWYRLVTANSGTYTFTELMQQDVHRQVSSKHCCYAQPATPAPNSRYGNTTNVSTATGGFKGYDYISNTYTFTPVVSISGTGLVTANAGIAYLRKRMQKISPYHQILLLMHNPLHQQLQQQEQLRTNMCNSNRCSDYRL